MRDVFKYFKYERSVQQDVLAESTTSERARELGYEYRSRGVWLDPRTGKRYRAQGTQFREIDDAQPMKENQQEPKKNQHLRENPNNRDNKRVVRDKFHPILRSTELFLVDPPTLSLKFLEINQELKNNSQEEENKYKVQRERHRSKLRQLL